MTDEQVTPRKSWGQLLVVSSLIFGMFFGSGNLIFPVHLGQLAGAHWWLAAIGFAISGSLFPLLAIMAVVVTRSDGLLDLARPLGRPVAAIFLILVHLTIGPFFATPRTAATAYQMALSPFMPQRWTTVGMLGFTGAFFIVTYLAATHQGALLKIVGKYLNVGFLALLALVFLVAFLRPMGSATHTPTLTYQTHAMIGGVLEGYNTLDAVALLALSVTLIHAIRGLGYRGQALTKLTAQAGIISILLEVLIYFGLVLLGALSMSQLTLSANGGVALSQIVGYYFNNVGTLLLGVLVTLGVLTTAIGLVSSFAQDFHKLFPKVSYRFWLRVTTGLSFLVANAGLNAIITWSLPVLMLMYPLALALIFLSLTVAHQRHAAVIYRTTMAFTILPALLDMLNSAPAVINEWGPIQTVLAGYHHLLPFASLGLGWLVPALVGFLGSWGWCTLRMRRHVVVPTNEEH